MNLKELQKNWNKFGQDDPLWAILTHAAKKGGKWSLEEFFNTGQEEIHNVLNWVNSLGIPLRKDRALDFGCGVGRLTQALCLYFEKCIGIDIAPSMIELAKKYNRSSDKCSYYVNSADDLALFESNYFDFIYSNIVLQHIEPQYSKKYIKEFVRVLAPGGIAVFQVPSKPAVQGKPLPDSSFQAQITPINDSINIKSGSQANISVKVKNTSEILWTNLNGQYSIRLGNHWLDEAGNLIINDDGRASLPIDLKPGAEVQLLLSVKAPGRPGNYILELDMVQESIAWFKNKGSKTARVLVKVESDSLDETKEKNTGRFDFTPRMEMHVLPKEIVLNLIDECKGSLVSAVENNNAPGWVSYTYCMTK